MKRSWISSIYCNRATRSHFTRANNKTTFPPPQKSHHSCQKWFHPPKKRRCDDNITLKHITELEVVCMKLATRGDKTMREIQRATVLCWEYGKRCGKQNMAMSAVSPKIHPLPSPSGGKQMHGVTSKKAGISALDIAEVRNQGRESEPP